MSVHIVPDYTIGEKCSSCGNPASHKVAEEAPMIFDQPGQVVRHAFTTYLCCQCFTDLMGLSPAACGLTPLTPDAAPLLSELADSGIEILSVKPVYSRRRR